MKYEGQSIRRARLACARLVGGDGPRLRRRALVCVRPRLARPGRRAHGLPRRVLKFVVLPWVTSAAKAGLMTGYKDGDVYTGHLGPEDVLTRAQTAMVL